MITKIRTADKQTFEISKCSVIKIAPFKTDNTLWYDVYKMDKIIQQEFVFTRINETQVGQIWYSTQKEHREDASATTV